MSPYSTQYLIKIKWLPRTLYLIKSLHTLIFHYQRNQKNTKLVKSLLWSSTCLIVDYLNSSGPIRPILQFFRRNYLCERYRLLDLSNKDWELQCSYCSRGRQGDKRDWYHYLPSMPYSPDDWCIFSPARHSWWQAKYFVRSHQLHRPVPRTPKWF